MIRTITADQFQSELKNGQDIHVLDVRTGLECKTEKLACDFMHVPLHELNGAAFAKQYGNRIRSAPLYILCRSGGRAQKAAQTLSPHIQDIVIVEGGIGACKSCGIATQKGQTLSLERQVRIAAGFLVLLGVILGTYVDPDFFILSGFVGAGLIFAGVTDKCGMALLIAHAPWNKTDIQSEINQSLQKFEKKGV